jgi:perosamine synthetase
LGVSPRSRGPCAHTRRSGQAEADAVKRVVESGCLPGFYGSWGSQFLGAPAVKEFEAAWCARFGVRHAVSVNSATSGLFAAMGAIGPSGFADIDPETFTLDVSAVEATITSRTRAIFAVFGQAARPAELRVLTDKRGLFLIKDNAQGPLAEEYGRYAGTIGHIGVLA